MVMLNLEDAATYLGQSPEEVKKLAERGDIESYKIGGAYLRFKKDHLAALKQKIHFEQNLQPRKPLFRSSKDSFSKRSSKAISDNKPRLVERIQDFWYFNNFYIISLGVIIALVMMILK